MCFCASTGDGSQRGQVQRYRDDDRRALSPVRATFQQRWVRSTEHGDRGCGVRPYGVQHLGAPIFERGRGDLQCCEHLSRRSGLSLFGWFLREWFSRPRVRSVDGGLWLFLRKRRRDRNLHLPRRSNLRRSPLGGTKMPIPLTASPFLFWNPVSISIPPVPPTANATARTVSGVLILLPFRAYVCATARPVSSRELDPFWRKASPWGERVLSGRLRNMVKDSISIQR